MQDESEDEDGNAENHVNADDDEDTADDEHEPNDSDMSGTRGAFHAEWRLSELEHRPPAHRIGKSTRIGKTIDKATANVHA